MGFGVLLKDLLAQRNLTIKDLSEMTGISINTLYSITKNDSVNVRSDTLKKISVALNIPMEKIIQMLEQEVQKNQVEIEKGKQLLYNHQRKLEEIQKSTSDAYVLLEEVRKLKQAELHYRQLFKQGLEGLTNNQYNDSEIDIILDTARVLKHPKKF